LGKPEEDDKLVCYHCGLECDLEAIRAERIKSWRSLERGIPVEIKTFDELFANAEKMVTRYRAGYCKLGEFRYLSALDLIRTFTRAFARANVPLKYSEGFNPAPNISFGPALNVGMESAEEFLDFETVVEIPAEKLLAALNDQMPADLKFTSLAKIDRKAPSLFQIINAAEYSASLDSDELHQTLKARFNGKYNGNLTALHEDLVEKFLKQESIEVEQMRKGELKTRDIKPLIKSIEVVNSSEPLHLRMILSTGSGGGIRPELILEKLYGVPPEHFKIRRERLLVEKEDGIVSPIGEVLS
jgi:radical SAM-linked protein